MLTSCKSAYYCCLVRSSVKGLCVLCIGLRQRCVAANVQCKLVNSMPVLSITAGIYTMIVVSVERVRCVLPAAGHDMPMPGTRSIGIRGTIIALAITWVLSTVIAVPAAVNFDVGIADDTDSSNQSLVVCHPTWNTLQTSVYSLFLLVVSYLLPQVVLYVNYGRLAAYLWRRRRAVAAAGAQPQSANAGSRTARHGSTSGATSAARTTLKTIKMLATVAILFLAAWAPYFTIMTIEVIHIFLITSTKGTIGPGRCPLAYLLSCVITVSPRLFINIHHHYAPLIGCSVTHQPATSLAAAGFSVLVKFQCQVLNR